MARLFVSYSREDQPYAERIARVLEKAGHQVWWDRHITSGREFAEEIETQLGMADIILVAWSAHAAKSPWVRDEAGIGRDKGRLLPVLVDGSQPPIGFRQFQALDLSGWKGREKDRRTKALLEAVDAVLNGSAPVSVPAAGRFAWSAGKRLWGAAAAIALIMAAAVALFVLRPGRPEAEPASLAVLPFKNLSQGDPYFAEGVAEEILNQLAREPQFKVAGRTSSALFKDAVDLREVGRSLQVAYVLEGSVRSAGNQVRVNVSLVDTRKGMRLWSHDYRGSLDDIFGIQDSIGQQVAAHVRRQLVAQRPAGDALKTSGDVYSLYVTARSLIRTREPARLATAVELLQRAVKIDANYAPAWARLAQASYMSRFYGHPDQPRANWLRPNELRYAERAIALAPDLAEAHAVMWLLLDSPNVSEAMKRRGRAEIERAVELDPTDAQNWYWAYIAREEELDFEGALAALRRTAEIDPFFTFSETYPIAAWGMGEREAALRFLKHRAEAHPDAYQRERTLSTIAYLQNDWSGVYRHLKRATEIAPPDLRPFTEEGLGLILARLGLREEAARYLSPAETARVERPPTPVELRDVDPFDYWSAQLMPVSGRMLINSGRSAELVSLYDRAFPSRDAMLERMDKLQFVERAPLAASALRAVGRNDEALHLLKTAERLCAQAMRRGRTPTVFQVNCSRSWAMLGRREKAVRTLERGLRAGWRPEDGWSHSFVDEPVYRSLRDDPRLKRLGRFVLAENAREGRELLAAGV